MKSNLNKYWEKSELRESMPQIISKEYIKDFLDLEEGESYIGKINKKLLEYEEIKYLCRKTKIKPFYYLLIIGIALCFILVGYFDKYLTLILATIYPLFMTFKTLQNFDEKNKQVREEAIHWLKYWIFYCVLLNFEYLLRIIFRRFYFFCKILFLFNCFPVNSRLTIYIYSTCLSIVRKYEPVIVEFCKNVFEHLTETTNEMQEKMLKQKKNDDYKEDEDLGKIIKEKGGNMAVNLLKNIY